jgi:DNA modification methylase
MKTELLLGDCLERLKELPDNSVDSIVTDPPYGLGKEPNALKMLTDWIETGHHDVKGRGFMGKEWDAFVPQPRVWHECLRVLKPGGHLLAFAGTRTQDLMALGLRLAGFEIRDMVAWVYGSGFPKSLDVSKAIDKVGGSNFMDWFPEWLEEYRIKAGVSRDQLSSNFLSRSGGKTGCIWNWEHGIRTPSAAQFNLLCEILSIPVEPIEIVERRFLSDRKGVTKTYNVGANEVVGPRDPITAPATDAAKQWNGWGTALKPAFESLTYATKPLDCLGYCSKMIANLNERIESCKQIANNAEKSSRHSQAASQEEKTNTAPESAAIHTEGVQEKPMEIGKADATSSRADTSESTPEVEPTALNTLLSWRNTLGGVFDVMRMSTTVTVFETITDWKILSYCLSQITPDTIIKARSNQSGLSADALRAVEYLNVSLACCANTLALSALAPAMSQEAERCRDAGVSPNLEPITLARKPLEGTVAANVLKWHTGALNIGGCRVGTEKVVTTKGKGFKGSFFEGGENNNGGAVHEGRWPANLIHDGSDEVLAGFPESSGKGGDSGGAKGTREEVGNFGYSAAPIVRRNDSGSAARFFYAAKCSKKDREGSTHPTMKPTDLMRYLCRLVTPPGGVILDPYMGSGSTGKAAISEDFRFIGIERDPDYFKIAEARIAAAREAALAQLAQEVDAL